MVRALVAVGIAVLLGLALVSPSSPAGAVDNPTYTAPPPATSYPPLEPPSR